MVALLLLVGAAQAQTLTFPTNGQFRPGQPMPVVIEATGPGLVEIRGKNIQGIDWPAGGRGTVTAPLIIWQAGGDLTLTVNGQAMPLKLTELAPSNPANAILADWADDDSLAIWSPGRPIEQRQWLMLAALAGTCAVGAAALWRGRWGSIAAILVAGGAGIAIFTLSPAPPVRRERPVRGQPGWMEIDYAATRAATVREPCGSDSGADLWFAPRSADDAAAAQPVLELSPAGQPSSIRIQMPDGGRARFLRHKTSSS